jgi:uncharacterized protein YukJ
MPIAHYGVLKGRPIRTLQGSGQQPHYQVQVIDEDTDYRIAINVKSQQSPSDLLYLVASDFHHPLLDKLDPLPLGFSAVPSKPGGIALDFIRANLFDPRDMKPLPPTVPGPDNDLNERLDAVISRAVADEEALVYAFGQRWGPEKKKDQYFGFKPGNGIHDIHMNQGNVGQFTKDNGVWQDGGLLVQFRGAQPTWTGVFLAFQSQSWHTNDQTGQPLVQRAFGEPLAAVAGSLASMPYDAALQIVAALVKPEAHAAQTVTLLNRSPEPVDLDGWSLVNSIKKRYALEGIIRAGNTHVVPLGHNAFLSPDGDWLTLLDPNGLKVTGTAFTLTDAEPTGWTIRL